MRLATSEYRPIIAIFIYTISIYLYITPCKKRDHNRGLRNNNSIGISREKRTNRIRVARRQKRRKGEEKNQVKNQLIPEAKAQEPIEIRMKILLGKTTRLATLRKRGMNKTGSQRGNRNLDV